MIVKTLIINKRKNKTNKRYTTIQIQNKYNKSFMYISKQCTFKIPNCKEILKSVNMPDFDQ